MNGVRRADYVRPLAATAEAGGLALSQTSIADYWYWASGVGVAGTLSPYAHAVLQDVSPSGRVLTYPAVYADATGAFSVLAKYDLFEVEDGTHTLRLTDDYGNVQTATLEVTPYPGRTLTVSVTPSSMTRTELYDHGITVSVSGLVPRSLAHIVIFTPAGQAYEIGPLGFLPADDSGRVTTVLDVSTGVLGTGTWEASVLNQEQTLSGYSTFTVTGPRPRASKGLALAPSITQAAFATGLGEAYTARRFAPFEIVEVDLTTTTGQIAFIGGSAPTASAPWRAGSTGSPPRSAATSSPSPRCAPATTRPPPSPSPTPRATARRRRSSPRAGRSAGSPPWTRARACASAGPASCPARRSTSP